MNTQSNGQQKHAHNDIKQHMISEFILLALFCSTFLSNHSCDKIPWSKIIYKTKAFIGLQFTEEISIMVGVNFSRF